MVQGHAMPAQPPAQVQGQVRPQDPRADPRGDPRMRGMDPRQQPQPQPVQPTQPVQNAAANLPVEQQKGMCIALYLCILQGRCMDSRYCD